MRQAGHAILPILLQLHLLHPFLQDIEGIQFESKIEEAWVEELEKITNKAHHYIDEFLRILDHQVWWLPKWHARGTLKKDIWYIDVQFEKLIERKERYGFKFL